MPVSLHALQVFLVEFLNVYIYYAHIATLHFSGSFLLNEATTLYEMLIFAQFFLAEFCQLQFDWFIKRSFRFQT